MKSYLAGLQNSTQTSYSNNGKTTMVGRAFQKTINSQSVIGPALTQFIDVQTTAGITPTFSYYNPVTGHLFIIGSAAANTVIALYNFNASTGVYSYVGKCNMWLANAAATTPAYRGFAVYESGGLIYPIVSASETVVINGGTYVGWGMSTADFTTGGGQIYPASGSNQKAVYFLQDPAALGVNHIATTSWGVALPQFSSSSSINTKVWQFVGTLLLPVLYSWDLSLTPTVAGIITNGVSAQTTLYAGTSPSAFFTMGASANGYSLTNGDAVVLQNGTGNVPTGFNAWASNSQQIAATNVYFVRDLQLVVGNYYFNLSSTTGGAAITPTSSTSSFTMMRAFGTNSSLFSLKTGTLPAFVGGVLIQNNSTGYCKPISAPGNTALNGQDCLYVATQSGLFMGKISDLTSLGTTWPSMNSSTSINATGTGMDIAAPTLAFAAYSGQGQTGDVDRWVYVTNGATYIVKPHQNSALTAEFGGTSDVYYETLNPVTIQPGVATVAGINVMGGWMFIASSTAGQRGIVFVDLYSGTLFGSSGVISPVLSVPAGSIFHYINTLEQLFDATNSFVFWIRSASTSSDPTFSSGTLPTSGSPGNWTLIKTATDLAATAIGPSFQLCATYDIALLESNTPAQLFDFIYTISPPGEISDYWEGSVDNTTQNGASPAYTAFRLTTTYPLGTVPTLYFRAYDDNGNLVISADTTTNPTFFSYTTNNGTAWNALGTVPNTPLTTEVRYQWASPPGVRVTCSLRES